MSQAPPLPAARSFATPSTLALAVVLTAWTCACARARPTTNDGSSDERARSASDGTRGMPSPPLPEPDGVSDRTEAGDDRRDAAPSPSVAGLDAGAREADDSDMPSVPAGRFVMGADRGGQEDERPAHAVTLAAFLLDRTEVTNEAYAACVTAKACRPHNVHIASMTHSGDDAEFNRPRRPVVGVAWQDARDYCAYRRKRLPREAEMERAIRGDDGRRFPWGDEAPSPDRTVFGRPLGHGHTDDVGTHPRGRGPYGHDDLAGNVWEWTEDAYDPYAYRRAGASEGTPGTCDEIRAAQDELRARGAQGFTGSNPIPTTCERSIRAGAFNYDGPGLRSTNRVHHPAEYRLVMLGFRCAKDAAP